MNKAQLNFDDLRIRAAVMRGVVAGVNDVSKALQAEVKLMLSRQGSGRVYVRRAKGVKGAYDKRALRALKSAGIRIVKKSTGRFFKFINRDVAARLLRDRRMKGLKNRSITKLGFHKASAPGQPPAPDTGHLRQTWMAGFGNPNVESKPNRYLLRVGAMNKYARRMEFGGGSIAPRPYIAPSIEIVRPKAKAMLEAAIRVSLAKFAKGGKP